MKKFVTSPCEWTSYSYMMSIKKIINKKLYAVSWNLPFQTNNRYIVYIICVKCFSWTMISMDIKWAYLQIHVCLINQVSIAFTLFLYGIHNLLPSRWVWWHQGLQETVLSLYVVEPCTEQRLHCQFTGWNIRS